MADNYLEKQYEAYQARKAAEAKRKKLLFQKQLKAYKARLENDKKPGTTYDEGINDKLA